MGAVVPLTGGAWGDTLACGHVAPAPPGHIAQREVTTADGEAIAIDEWVPDEGYSFTRVSISGDRWVCLQCHAALEAVSRAWDHGEITYREGYRRIQQILDPEVVRTLYGRWSVVLFGWRRQRRIRRLFAGGAK